MKLKMTDRYVEMHTYLSGYKYDGKDMVNWKPIIPFFQDCWTGKRCEVSSEAFRRNESVKRLTAGGDMTV